VGASRRTFRANRSRWLVALRCLNIMGYLPCRRLWCAGVTRGTAGTQHSGRSGIRHLAPPAPGQSAAGPPQRHRFRLSWKALRRNHSCALEYTRKLLQALFELRTEHEFVLRTETRHWSAPTGWERLDGSIGSGIRRRLKPTAGRTSSAPSSSRLALGAGQALTAELPPGELAGGSSDAHGRVLGPVALVRSKASPATR
jgi:hypothetical protein